MGAQYKVSASMDESNRLNSLRIVYRGKSIHIPKAIYSSILYPSLSDIRIFVSGERWELEVPYLVFQDDFAKETCTMLFSFIGTDFQSAEENGSGGSREYSSEPSCVPYVAP
jgi:hypothetical protein